MRARLALITIALALVIPAAAHASLAGEQRQGQNLIAQLQTGTKTCRDLSADDLDHIGEYLMFRALGSTSLHQAMNDRMIAMLGEQGESRIHQLLGARYAGCSNTSASGGHGGMMGSGGMMGGDATAGYYNDGGLGAMMSSGDWTWMMGGAWQNMTSQDWQRLQQRLLGTNASASTGGGGWSPVAIVATTVGAVALVGLALLLAIRRAPAAAGAGLGRRG